ncbi:MAG: S8 family serine peptidase [Dehalococcoidia bacterium]
MHADPADQMNSDPRRSALVLIVAAAMISFVGGDSLNNTPAASAAPSFPVRSDLGGAPSHPVAKPGELIVHFKPGATVARKRSILGGDGATIVRDLGLPDYSLVRVPPGREDDFARRLSAASDVLTAEPNLMRWASLSPNDPAFPFQWHFNKIGLPNAWDKASGVGVIVAVLDTGVAFETCSMAVCGANYTQAPDFAGTTFVSPRDEVNNDSHPNDRNGHGTHVTSTIAEATNNSLGGAGIAYNAQIMPVQILAANGNGTVADEIDGITWAINHGAKVINMSLGGSGGVVAEEAAIDNAVANGIVVAVAAGNGGEDGIGDPVLDCPACYPNSIAVGATRFDQARSPYSNYGDGLDGHTLDIMAPGGDVTVNQNGDAYGDGVLQQTFAHACGSSTVDYSAFVLCFYQGTSMATPHVAGVAALVRSIDPTLTAAQVRTILTSTATDLGPPGYDTDFGYGEVNAAAAVAVAAVDTDGDGCPDARELLPKAAAGSGGGRDPNNFWDFFDTPDTGNIRDRAVSAGDIIRLVFRFGTNGSAAIDPLSAPPPGGYHTAFDRTPPNPGANPWNLNPPDGAIAVNDILFSVAQFGHTCV